MTILVAVKKFGRVFMGADRIVTFGTEYFTDLADGSKIMKLKHAYLATSGYSLLDNIIEHLHETNHKMMSNTFKNRAQVFSFFLELYAELKKSYTLVDSGKDTYAAIYNNFMVVTPQHIYGVANNLSVSQYERFACLGAGSDYSLGCLYGLFDTIDDGFELCRIGLEAACHFSVYCKEPLDVIEVKASDFGTRPARGYKSHGRALKTLAKRKTPGNLLVGTKTTQSAKGPKRPAGQKDNKPVARVAKSAAAAKKRPARPKSAK
jgi:ATP-dependent protease HslVU (ClpYQ) peptidase subunit